MSQDRTADPGRRSAPHSQTLDRGIRVLEVLAEAGEPLSISDLVVQTDLHRSIVYRILRTLEDHRLISRNGDGLCEPGPGLAMLARSVQRTLQDAALPVLSELANEVGMTAFLVVPDQGEAVTITSIEPRHSHAHVAYRPGMRHSLNRGAPGLAILAGGPPRRNERVEVVEARARGWAYSRGEVLSGMSSVAAPVIDASGNLHGAAAVVFVDTGGDLETLGTRVVKAAQSVATELT